MIESFVMTRRLGVLVALLALAATASADKAKPKAPAAKDKAPAAAKAPAPDQDAPADGSADAADGSAQLPPGWTLGPKLIDLGDNDEVDLPAGLAFVDRAAAKTELEKAAIPLKASSV